MHQVCFVPMHCRIELTSDRTNNLLIHKVSEANIRVTLYSTKEEDKKCFQLSSTRNTQVSTSSWTMRFGSEPFCEMFWMTTMTTTSTPTPNAPYWHFTAIEYHYEIKKDFDIILFAYFELKSLLIIENKIIKLILQIQQKQKLLFDISRTHIKKIPPWVI